MTKHSNQSTLSITIRDADVPAVATKLLTLGQAIVWFLAEGLHHGAGKIGSPGWCAARMKVTHPAIIEWARESLSTQTEAAGSTTP